ncbi:hypothetical protein CEXT_281431 [Caerostris extrusa]|uniref:Uncharacterized protein n=1 Tax=Caerostris extrusa TaxID=172846 RepID=A0AAV4XYM6_CAEEX|nr:hypothetical protein CEXT_281431 [Caerostris extrusa]
MHTLPSPLYRIFKSLQVEMLKIQTTAYLTRPMIIANGFCSNRLTPFSPSENDTGGGTYDIKSSAHLFDGAHLRTDTGVIQVKKLIAKCMK